MMLRSRLRWWPIAIGAVVALLAGETCQDPLTSSDHLASTDATAAVIDLAEELTGGTVEPDALARTVTSSSSFSLKCYSCQVGVDLLMFYHRTGAPKSLVLKTVGVLCTILGIEQKPLCTGYVDSIGKHLFAIFDKDVNGEVKSADICGMALRGKCELASHRLNDWRLNIPDLDNEPKAPPIDWEEIPRSTQKILHLTDVHLQLGYKIGTNAKCGFPMCCDPSIEVFLRRRHAKVAELADQDLDFQETQDDRDFFQGEFDDEEINNLTLSREEPIPASPVGEYACDLPVWTAEAMLRNIRKVHPDIAYIMLTGDFPGHGTWHQGRSENVEATNDVVAMIKGTFPNVTVFPNVGNHESYPVNMFPEVADGNFSIKWLYRDIAEQFKEWLPDEEQQRTLRDAGYYSVLAREGLRVISVNTNYCNNFNFWLALNFNDPHKHLHWLYQELKKAEDNRESVYILGHIPTGSESCTGRWAEEFNRILRRFRNTVTAQFFGHTHRDEFQIAFSDVRPGKGQKPVREPIGVTYVAPSMTPIDGVNPAYRIYTVQGDYANSSSLVFDHQTFWLDLEAAKADLEANVTTGYRVDVSFRPEYTARQALEGKPPSPKNWAEYVRKMSENKALFAKFRQRMSRNGPSTASADFSQKEWKDVLCQLLTSWSLGGNQSSPECQEIARNVDSKNPWAWWHVFKSP